MRSNRPATRRFASACRRLSLSGEAVPDIVGAKLRFTLDELAKLKSEVLRGRHYADRVSTVMTFHLLLNRETRGDYFPVLDELDFLEGITGSTRTKEAARFERGPINFLYHKHYSAARHILPNIVIRWNLNRDLTEMIREVAREHDDNPEALQVALTTRLMMDGYQDRVRRGATGDWIIFGKHAGKNYYLGLASHEEGRQPDRLLAVLKQNCESEYPFIFDSK